MESICQIASGPLAKVLREARLACGLSQDRAARAIGVTKNVVYNWERGHRRPRVAHLLRLADLYGISRREFFDLIEEDP